jgi:hypothetical protein
MCLLLRPRIKYGAGFENEKYLGCIFDFSGLEKKSHSGANIAVPVIPRKDTRICHTGDSIINLI